MSAGNQPSLEGVNGTAGSLSVTLRNTFTAIEDFQQWLTAVGGSPFLQTQLGFTQADADVIVSTMGNLDRLRTIYQNGPPGNAFDYEGNSRSLWGGQ